MNDPLNGLSLLIESVTEFGRIITSVFDQFQNWYQKNAETIRIYMEAFLDIGIWLDAVKKLSDQQIIFTDTLSIEQAKVFLDSADITKAVQDYYFGNEETRMQELILRCQNAKQLQEYSELYDETMSAYRLGHYHLGCIGLFSLSDGILADTSHMMTSTGFRGRIEAVKQKIADKLALTEIDRKIMCIYISIDSFDNSIFRNSDFSKCEPESLNRHWVLHGRTRRTYTKFDFLKILLWIDALAFLDDLCASTGEELGE